MCVGCDSFKNGRNELEIPKSTQSYEKKDIITFKGEVHEVYYQGDGNLLVRSSYDSCIYNSDGKLIYKDSDGVLASYILGNKISLIHNNETSFYTAIDLNTNEEIVFDHDYLPSAYEDGLYVVRENPTAKYGMLNDKNEIIIPFQYESLSCFDKKGLAIASKDGKLYGAIDKNNNVVIPFKYNFLYPFDLRMAFSGSVGNFFDDYTQTYDYTRAVVNREGEECIIDRKGNIVLDLTNSEYKPCRMSGYRCGGLGLIPVTLDNACGFINMQGKLIIPCKYNKICTDFFNGYAVVTVGDDSGLINSEDKKIIPFEYYYLGPPDQKGFLLAKKSENSPYQIIDLAGNIVYEAPESHMIEEIGGGFFIEKMPDSASDTEDEKESREITVFTFNKK